VQYPAPGSLELASLVKGSVAKTNVEFDQGWGLDHGCWSVIKHMYPKADIPLIQMSLDHYKNARFHYDLGKELSSLRRKRILIAGSGNIVHNLRMVDWQNSDTVYDWAETADAKLKKLISDNEHQQLIRYELLGREIELSVPTPEHYLPLLYALALKEGNDRVRFFNDKRVMGSLSMTSLIIERG
jgi:4,5-DOPA dioxygenase extradiol